MKEIEKKHPLAIRWFHWVNFPILLIMIWSGMLIYWANGVYKIQIGDVIIIKFFPEWFYKMLKLPYRLAEGMATHFVFMWIFFLNGFFYVVYTLISGEWRYLIPTRKSFKEAWQVLLHDLHISPYHPPQSKYNGAQKIAYSAIILMGFGSLVTGLAIYKPVQVHWLTWLMGGYSFARALHFILTIGYVLFFLIHIIQVIRAGWSNFQSMITGFEVKKNITPPIEEKPEETPSPIIEA
ncbi:cytochrome b/b6 domain-containing protein [Emticicia sp. BO119]|uniref:cytochrome b/b6 domain-containing protein n=1 Tax=Emticicia sp. BO119 TaxID=2757768 RepID=UPI0015F079B3|nr:cytochrome b/b6 domain-containing protein [Emticicia sp. BO119]MBA4849812.1 cytochrome b/b6 domain-containing protein [Emticicia sp. BO119]